MSRVPEDYIGDAPWYDVVEELPTSPPAVLTYSYSSRFLRDSIAQFDAALQAGKIEEALSSLPPTLIAGLQYLHHNRNFIPDGFSSKEQVASFLDVADYLWGWASRAKELDHGWDGVVADQEEMNAWPVVASAETDQDEDDISEVDINETFFPGGKPSAPTGDSSGPAGEKSAAENAREAEHLAAADDDDEDLDAHIVAEDDMELPPHKVLYKAATSGWTKIVNNLLLNFRFSPSQMKQAVHNAFSGDCSFEMYIILEHCCATYLNFRHSSVPFHAGIEKDQYRLDRYTFMLKYHLAKYPEILLETKSRLGEPLLVHAIREQSSWELTKLFVPENMPYDWLFSQTSHPFGRQSLSLAELREALLKYLPAQSHHRFALQQSKALTWTEEEIEAQLLDQAEQFVNFWNAFSYAASQNNTEEMVHYLRLMIRIVDNPNALEVVKRIIGQPDYSRKMFGLELWDVLIHCTSAEVFSAIRTICSWETTKDHPNLLAYEKLEKGNGVQSSEDRDLLRDLLAVHNCTLIKELLKGVDADSGYSNASFHARGLLFGSPCGLFPTLMHYPEITPDLLEFAAQCCHEQDRVADIDAADEDGNDPMILALEITGRIDLLLVLLRCSNDVFMKDDAGTRCGSFLSYYLQSQIDKSIPDKDELVTVAKAMVDQARRVLGKKKSKPSLAFYMDFPGEDGKTPLQMAFEMQNDELMEYILAAGASPFACIPGRNDQGTTTLCHRFIEQDNLADLKRILSMSDKYFPCSIPGIDTCVDRNDLTALELAAKLKNLAAVKMLIQFGASLLPFTASSPFVDALLQRKKSPGKGADALVKTLFTGWSAKCTVGLVSSEAEEKELLLLFMKSQVSAVIKPYMKKVEDRNTLIQGAVEALSHTSALFDLVLENNKMPAPPFALKLHSTLDYLKEEDLKRLIKAGVDLSMRSDGVTVHFVAVQAANIPLLTLLLDASAGKIDFLKETDLEGNALLHWAVLKTPSDKETRDPVIEFLIAREPKLLYVLNKAGQSPREYAKSRRIKRLLKEAEEKYTSARIAAGKDEFGGPLERAGDTVTATKIKEDAVDLTVLGPLDEPEKNKRRRLVAMIDKLTTALQESSQSSVNAAVKGSLVGVNQTADDTSLSAAASAAFGSIVTAAADATLPEVEIAAVEVYDSGDEYEDTVDEPEEQNLVAAAAKTAAGRGGFTALGAELQGLPWELIVTREAYLEWGGMDDLYRRMVLLKLREIGQGRWESMGACKRRMRDVPPELNLWRCKFTKAGRIVFDIAQDYSASRGNYTDLIRIWSITLNHDRYMNEVQKVIQSFAKSHRVTAALRLTPVEGSADTGAGPRDHKAEQNLPRVYYRQGNGDEMQLAAAAAAQAKQQEVLQYPPATSGQGSYTLLKFFDLTTELARAILSGMAGAIETPFRVSPEETRIITTNPGCSIILAGRSGTGKTTCACFKLFARWLTDQRLNEPHNQIFVTASGTLRREVARSFAKMRRAVVDPDQAEYFESYADMPLVSLKDVPADAFPLFLSQKTYLEALDGTLAVPFFPRREDGSIMWERGGDASDPDGMSQEIDLSPESDFEDESEEDISDDEGLLFEDDSDEEKGAGGAGGGAQARRWNRQEMGFTEFQAKWSQFVPQDLRKGSRVPPALVWTDLVSYIKGSAEAVRSPTGHLTLEQYLELGRKRAPNFDPEHRKDVYRVFEAYEKYKKSHSRYDTADLVGHISRRLIEEGGYNGVDISAIFRDEVQDFMQGELLLDLRVATNPNQLFLSGDSAQTIARGLGFRFADIKTLFYEEGASVLSAQKKAAARLRARSAVAAADGGGGGAVDTRLVKKGDGDPLQMPIIEHLTVNYRTHSGILDAAASTVDLLRRYFPEHIDNMQREKAFFSGPPILLVCGGGAEDMARLLSWSDKKASQVEFGAHQVVLIRDENAKDSLPIELRGARPLTIPQSKGLEFDDVLLYNFFSDSMAKKEWRVLLNYLEELEREESTAEASATAGRRRLLSVEEAQQGVGKLGHDALRPLENIDPNMIRPLCDELKHLYTALTRAKNFVAIVDSDAEARAPFYYFLARLGLGRIVTDVGKVDKTHLGLSKVESKPVDWAERGIRLMQQCLFVPASEDFQMAGDKAMQQYCLALDLMAQAVEKAVEAPSTARKLYFTAGLQLMDLAVNGSRPLELREALKARGQSDFTRRVWARRACDALERAGETKMASSLHFKLGRFEPARQLLLDSGDVEGAAKCCADVSAHFFAQGKERLAMKWAVEAFKQYKNAKQYKRCLEMLESVTGLYEYLDRFFGAAATAGKNPAEEVARQLIASGDAVVAARAKKFVRVGLNRNAPVGVAGVDKSATGAGGAGEISSDVEGDGGFESLNLFDSEDENEGGGDIAQDDDFFLVVRSRRGRAKSGKKKRSHGTQ